MRRTALALVLSLLVPGVAGAESRRWGSFEVAAGPYLPDIDSEFSAPPDPYARTFADKRGWMFRLAASRAIFTRVGSLEVGLKTGFFRVGGDGMSVDNSTSPPTYTPSGDSTAFWLVPTSATLTYRFDWLADRWGIPLAPYGTVAFERYNWWITDGSGNWVKEGATNGWSVTGGLALLLDFFDRQMARELDQESGINHTYVFADVTKTRVNDFGSSKSWDLSDTRLSFAFGLLFVF